MSEPYIGQIQIFGFDYAPKGWAWCDGTLLPIPQFTALFSILGTTYGGDGRSTFAVPALQGCVPLGQGEAPGLSSYVLGEAGGMTAVTLSNNEMARHSHSLNTSGGFARGATPVGQLFAIGVGESMYGPTGPTAPFSPSAVEVAGQSVPHNNLQPFLSLNFCIALDGVYPPRP